jgi:MoaA/NifB/PqqE/SkfB family radical SAM enzyme
MMSVAASLLRGMVSRRIGRCLTGKPEDLRRLSALGKLSVDNPGLQAFLRGLSRDIEAGGERGMAALFTRLGSAMNGRARHKLVENLIFNWGVQGARIRTDLASEDLWVPSLVVISPTMRCNLKCTGCYSGLYTKDGELSKAELERILDECRRLGVYFVVISGGEPYVLKDTLLSLFKKYNDMFFLTYTNGTMLDEPTVKALARLGNVAPAISVEGYREHTDGRRSAGVYEKVLRAMELLKRYGVLFGMSVTYTRENIEVITRDEFIQYYLERGIIFAWYFMFMPVGKDPILDLVPTPQQRVYCGNRVAEMREKYPVFLADFWNDGPAVGGCLAGARSYLHVLNSGRIEPCVFAHFGMDNIREKSILEAANSPFFRAIRARFPYNEEGNLKRPCMIIDNPQVLRDVVDEYLVPQGHQHSEDIIHDPNVVAWIDEYSQAFKALTDPVWEQAISDPSYRWYRGGAEYRNLFRFQEAAREKAQKAVAERGRGARKDDRVGVPGS